MALTTIEEYIEDLTKLENHPIGKTQFLNFDFDFMPLNSPIGRFLKSDSEHFIIMLGNEFNLRLYRGENKENPNFAPTINRNNMRPGNIEHCFEWIKTEQFKEAFEKSILYKKLSELEIDGCSFNINLDALAQHYGFKTSYLDLTQSRLVAQFFAYTDYDQNKKEFFPITNFKEGSYKPIIYEIKITDLYKLNPDAFKIIGFQPLARPIQQIAFGIDTSMFNEDLKSHFTKIEMTPDPDGAKYIFEKFEGGKILFPKEDAEKFYDDIRNSSLNNKKFIPEHLLNKYCNKFDLNFDDYKTVLTAFCTITDKVKFEIQAKDINEIANYLDNITIPFIMNNIGHLGRLQLSLNF